MSGSGASGTFERSSEAAIVRAECDIPGLYVRRLQIAADGEPDLAVLVAKPSDKDGNAIRFEQVLSLAAGEAGTPAARKVTIYGDAGRGTRQALFHGRILTAQVRAAERGEEIVYTALGLKHELMVEKMYGCWAKDSQDMASHLKALPLVFNPEGKKNKNKNDLADTLGDVRICFTHDYEEEDAELWTAHNMVRYCATAERKASFGSEPRVFEVTAQVGGELAKFKPYDVNLEGEDIWSGIVRIAALCSHGVVFRYGKTRADSKLRFFTRKLDEAKTTKQFEFPAAGGPLSAAITDRGRLLDSIDYQMDWAGIVRYVDAVAPPKVYESTFTLQPGWKQVDEADALGGGDAAAQLSNFLRETDPETSSDWPRFRNVGRRWILNETGRDDVRDGSNTPYDFSGLFSSAPYAERFRPFRRDLATKDDAGQRLPPRVRITFAGMSADIQLGSIVTLLEDRAGIYFSGRPMIAPASFIETAAPADLFPTTVTITATVEGDQGSPADVQGVGTPAESPLPSFGIVRLDDAFRQDNINADSAEADAQEVVDAAAEEMRPRREVGTVTSPFITNQFSVGDVIDKINGRDLEMKAVIVKVAWDFETQSTEFALQVPELDTETHGRNKSNLEGAGVGARSDKALSDLRSILGHKRMGHPVEGMLRDAMRGYDPFGGQRVEGSTDFNG